MTIVNTYYPPYPRRVSDASHLCVVLTQDEAGLFACYAGYVRDPEGRNETWKKADEQWVAHSGQKLNYATARAFYDVGEERYRR